MIGLVASRILRILVVGLIGGAIASYWVSRLVTPLLFGVGPHDPTTLVIAVSLMFGVTALATALPAWRATRIEPATVLREQ